MASVWLTSDTHFGHAGVCRFLRDDGSKLRPWDNPQDMDRDMAELWNKTVGKDDLVYHLGDAVINRRCLESFGNLNGRKVLIKGNHDNFRLNEYSQFFEDIKGSHCVADFILTHIPVHPNQFPRFRGNFHGHLHAHELEDTRYLNVCVEHTGYKPILLERAIDKFKERNMENNGRI